MLVSILMTTEISERPQVEKEGIFQERGNRVRKGRGGTRIGGLNRGWNGDQDKGGDRGDEQLHRRPFQKLHGTLYPPLTLYVSDSLHLI